MAVMGNLFFSIFLRLTWEFLSPKSERGGSVCCPNNKIIDRYQPLYYYCIFFFVFTYIVYVIICWYILVNTKPYISTYSIYSIGVLTRYWGDVVAKLCTVLVSMYKINITFGSDKVQFFIRLRIFYSI